VRERVCGCAIGGDRQIFATKFPGVAVCRPILLQQVVQETVRAAAAIMPGLLYATGLMIHLEVWEH
jgi:hypothetical protein